MDEEVDIDEGLRTWIREVHAQLDRMTHYHLLGLRHDADPKDIKRAYMRLAGMVHPDRFIKKRLGAYKPMMEVVFARLSEAHETLRVPERRQEYDALLAEDAAAAGVEYDVAYAQSPAPKAPVDPRVAAERQKAMDALRQRFEAGKNDAQKHVEAAKRAHAAGDVPGAIEAYRRAALAAPTDATIKQAIADLEEAAGQSLIDSHAKKAALEERFGRWADAAASWQKVVEARPRDVEAQRRLANALARSGAGRQR